MKSINIKNLLTYTVGLVLMAMAFGCGEEETVIPRDVQEYLDDLSIIVETEKAAVQTCEVGYNKGDFKVFEEMDFDTVTNRYLDSLIRAEEIMAIPGVTIEELMYANRAITVPGDEFHARVFISDRRPLQEAIVFCDTLRVNTPVGAEAGQAPHEADSIFKVAIDEAKYWRNLATTIDRQVAAETDSLNQELAVYQAAINK